MANYMVPITYYLLSTSSQWKTLWKLTNKLTNRNKTTRGAFWSHRHHYSWWCHWLAGWLAHVILIKPNVLSSNVAIKKQTIASSIWCILKNHNFWSLPSISQYTFSSCVSVSVVYVARNTVNQITWAHQDQMSMETSHIPVKWNLTQQGMVVGGRLAFTGRQRQMDPKRCCADGTMVGSRVVHL